MNAAVRAVVRTAAFYGLEVVGVRRGFSGLRQGDMSVIGPRHVANTLQRGAPFCSRRAAKPGVRPKAALKGPGTCASGGRRPDCDWGRRLLPWRALFGARTWGARHWRTRHHRQ
ncbi:6-phosphofructokinase [Deinococcus lacus]|uniref:6-phosphofructokinase n=1 Tax=Deinococcus lacus TaxID=392561 RepID=A0ABW1YCM8_9DEIO